ncbi:Deoxyribose-phosphate aldolase 1 [Candidatus Izimaplasma bacterium HR1]|jgi:deoxyribose-phosphate aldolase|uniref:deoxyribose-phosphate aldolase n=1 Tax=Candidatus Izimoplasma sp. HR1 TaxID=1541959 RepID=UPI0004F69B53|nr:Deoxyribose-phosphate aldolase 1 [Candidatus Izimaplasma bacterium HR1]
MKINKLIDHTYLKAFGTDTELNKLLEEAKEFDFKSVCVNPFWVAKAAKELKGTDVLVCTVIGFPLGANTSAVKVYEAKDAINNGANEIDMVLNVGKVKMQDYDFIYNEVKSVKEACGNLTLKVILETCYLTKEEIRLASEACIKAGADFVKTSTGFGTGGALIEDVKIMKEVAKDKQVKASGGVRSFEDVEKMVEAGATRIGTSSGVKLVQGKVSDSDY